MSDRHRPPAHELKWSAGSPPRIGTLSDDGPPAMPPSSLKHSWREAFGSRDGFGTPGHARASRRGRLVVATIVSGFLLTGALATGLAGASAVTGGKDSASSAAVPGGSHNPGKKARKKAAPATDEVQRDVVVHACNPSEDGLTHADLMITNHGAARSNYVIAVEFANGQGRRAGTGYVNVTGVEPGKTSGPWTASSFKSAPSLGFTCHVGQVTRYAF